MGTITDQIINVKVSIIKNITLNIIHFSSVDRRNDRISEMCDKLIKEATELKDVVERGTDVGLSTQEY
jgi:hypothetical protein